MHYYLRTCLHTYVYGNLLFLQIFVVFLTRWPDITIRGGNHLDELLSAIHDHMPSWQLA